MRKAICYLIALLFLFTGIRPVVADTITHSVATELIDGVDAKDATTARSSGKRKFDAESYKKATDGLDYKEKTPDPPKYNFDPPQIKSFLGIGQILLIVAIVLLLVAIVYFISRNIPVSNPSVSGDDDWISSVMEKENGPGDILQLKLEDALEEGNYALAVRILYLQVLVQLNQHKLIIWKKDKTNLDYVTEMRKTNYHIDFRNLTRVYEYSWFSDTPPNSDDFKRIKPLFDSFKETVRRTDMKEA